VKLATLGDDTSTYYAVKIIDIPAIDSDDEDDGALPQDYETKFRQERIRNELEAIQLLKKPTTVSTPSASSKQASVSSPSPSSSPQQQPVQGSSNVVAFYETHEEQRKSKLYIVMEYVEGGDLFEKIGM